MVLPDTPADEVVQVVQLTPKNGGLTQSQVYMGSTTRLGTVLGQDGWPSPSGVIWKPELAPDRDYCASISFYGRNDQALLPLRSTTLCTSVTSLVRSEPSSGCSYAASSREAGLWFALAAAVLAGCLAQRRAHRRDR